jgi:hypothetical protein
MTFWALLLLFLDCRFMTQLPNGLFINEKFVRNHYAQGDKTVIEFDVLGQILRVVVSIPVDVFQKLITKT